jgi:ribosomal protein S18
MSFKRTDNRLTVIYSGVLRGENGASLVLVVMALIPILALLAMAVDSFALLTSKLEQNNNADYAALSALGVAIDNTTNLADMSRIPAAIAKAELVAGRNFYIANRSASQVGFQELQQGTAGSVLFGFFRKTDRTFTLEGVCSATGVLEANGVQVQLNTQEQRVGRATSRFKAFFSGVFGQKEFDSRALRIAYWDATRRLKSFVTPDTRIIPRNNLDVNGDGVVATSDYTLLSNFVTNSGVSSLPTGVYRCYDLNSDGYISARDVSILYNYLNNNLVN